MDNKLKKPLQTFVEGYATQTLEGTDAAIHEYICRKTQSMLLGEEADEKDEDLDKEDKVDEDDDKQQEKLKRKDDKKEEELEKDDDDEDLDEKDVADRKHRKPAKK